MSAPPFLICDICAARDATENWCETGRVICLECDELNRRLAQDVLAKPELHIILTDSELGTVRAWLKTYYHYDPKPIQRDDSGNDSPHSLAC